MTWEFVLQLIVLALVATFLVTVLGAMFRIPARPLNAETPPCRGLCCAPLSNREKGEPPW